MVTTFLPSVKNILRATTWSLPEQWWDPITSTKQGDRVPYLEVTSMNAGMKQVSPGPEILRASLGTICTFEIAWQDTLSWGSDFTSSRFLLKGQGLSGLLKDEVARLGCLLYLIWVLDLSCIIPLKTETNLNDHHSVPQGNWELVGSMSFTSPEDHLD